MAYALSFLQQIQIQKIKIQKKKHSIEYLEMKSELIQGFLLCFH